MSLSDYLIAEVRRAAERSTCRELLETLQERSAIRACARSNCAKALPGETVGSPARQNYRRPVRKRRMNLRLAVLHETHRTLESGGALHGM